MRGTDVLIVAREVQIPMLAVLLIVGCAAKAHQVIAARSVAAWTGPTALFPVRLRGPAAIGVCATELILGVGLLVTAGRVSPEPLALVVRTATALLLGTATAALHELRALRPDTGCGCFGELSDAPVSWRTIVRALLLSVAALSTIGVPPLHMPASPARAALVLAIAAAELAAIAALSPEIGVILARLGHAEPCELRRVPVARTLDSLRASPLWRRYHPHLVSGEPADVWREGCWRFLVFPGVIASRRVDVVFAVSLVGRRAPVRAGLLDVDAAPAPRLPFGEQLPVSNRV